eukprot:8257027-Alexandrium_andersonii.AAC.1
MALLSWCCCPNGPNRTPPSCRADSGTSVPRSSSGGLAARAQVPTSEAPSWALMGPEAATEETAARSHRQSGPAE